ncbi:heparinase II/III family protein [Paenibacillus tritici]|uniref:heparinase II/III family protein n=1 Tax=Paenibacillus tritici TaxID=1873425 RepID=UPI001BA9C325|nr:heparinase II/III family protein [Paenibacillus tritici]QUL53900.1 heparinase II/III family protein [Paenibacillus tritici]
MKTTKKIMNKFFSSNSEIKKIIIKKALVKLNMNYFLYKYENMHYIKNKIPKFESLIDYKKINIDSLDTKKLDIFSDLYISHKFNILGSGWVSANYNAKVSGIENILYETHNKRPYEKIVREIVDKNYSLIDWQRDLKSGYLFDAEETSTSIKNLPQGVDLKMPWELSRMYHLPQLAIIAILMKEKRIAIIREFKNQIYDFCESNPLGKGVNWICTMDVSIRIVNILISYDIFLQIDEYGILDVDFNKYLQTHILKHGKFIKRNLEINISNTKVNGNHYLSNLCGLLFVSTYFRSRETQKWLEFASREFLVEFQKQFLDDGSNFECSTAYHRLSGEISSYSIALLLRNHIELDNEILKKMNSIAKFAILVTRDNGDMIQIGDNDSGRLLKLDLKQQIELQNISRERRKRDGIVNDPFVENELNNYSLPAAIFAITNLNDLNNYAKKSPIDFSIMNALVNQNSTDCQTVYDFSSYNYNHNVDVTGLQSKFKHKKTTTIFLPYEDIILNNSVLNFSPHFGIAVFEMDNFKLFVRTPTDLEDMHTAHIHNDFLHFEMDFENKSYFCDQGSYIYTPLINKRNQFRSVRAHNIPNHGIETNDFVDCFNVRTNIKGEVLQLSNNSIELMVCFNDIFHYRKIELDKNMIVITDKSSHFFDYTCKDFDYVSSGYGRLLTQNVRHGLRITSV